MPKTIIVVPCFNEATRLQSRVFMDYAQHNPEVSFLFVNDGSNDTTQQLLEHITEIYPQCHCLHLQHNQGKAEAVRQGMLYGVQATNCDYIGFWDADLATPLNEIEKFASILQSGDYDIVIGLRLARLGARIARKKSRHYLGRCFATITSQILHIPIYDSQCGAKMMRRVLVEKLFQEPFDTKWLFDVEIFARYLSFTTKEDACKRICEYPLAEWHDIKGSRLKATDFLRAPWELMKIKVKYKL